jgi:hypothetical protein
MVGRNDADRVRVLAPGASQWACGRVGLWAKDEHNAINPKCSSAGAFAETWRETEALALAERGRCSC